MVHFLSGVRCNFGPALTDNNQWSFERKAAIMKNLMSSSFILEMRLFGSSGR
jgi:hypothetical protein